MASIPENGIVRCFGLEIPATEISSAKVMLTIFDGEVIYDAGVDPTGEEAIEDATGVDLDLSGNASDPNNEWNNLFK